MRQRKSMDLHLSQNLKKLRSHKRLSQERLADALGISRNKIASYEGKGIEPSLRLLIKMSLFFEVSIDDLVRKRLTQDNIVDAQSAYRRGGRLDMIESKGVSPDEILEKLSPTAVEHFVEKNHDAKRILDGFKAFYDLKAKEGPIKEEISNLFFILEDVLNTNQQFVDSINK